MNGIYDSDIFFLHRLKSGDEKAFESIFKSDYNRIVGFCSQFADDMDKSRSFAQEAFLNLWVNREKIESVNGIRSFLYTYAKSCCLNDIRHKKITGKYQDKLLQEAEDQFNQETLESFDFHSLEYTELDALIRKSVDELPEKARQVFVMSRYDGKMNKDIAQELGISVKSVEANITRALKSLKTNLSEYLPLVLVELIMQYISR